jgi:hypothetical protein
LPLCTSCNFKNFDDQVKDEKGDSSHSSGDQASRDQEVDNGEEIAAEESWICVVCRKENGQHDAICYQCNAARQHEDHVQPQGDGKEIQEEGNEASDLEDEDDENNPNKDQCPVCLEWFTKEQQAECKYWVCDHFVCKRCYGNIKNAKKLQDCCPTCRCQTLRPQQGEGEKAQHKSD